DNMYDPFEDIFGLSSTDNKRVTSILKGDVYLNNKSNEEFSMLEMLYEQIVEDDLDEAHILLDNVFKGQGNQINAVISMYRNMNPANEILEELHEWAIKH